MNATSSPQSSFVPVESDSHFPIQNLPFGIFRPQGEQPRAGVAIGKQVLDLAALERRRLLPPSVKSADGSPLFDRGSLNAFMGLGRAACTAVRNRVAQLLSAAEPTLRDDAALRKEAIWPASEVELLLPAEIGDYSDFYSSREHATNVGAMFRGRDNALFPNWLHLPVAYHGRASSIVPSGTDIHRPLGQTKSDADAAPKFGPSQSVDFELEMGLLIGRGNELGEPIPIVTAAEHVFGLVLVNDWSARDVQRWEYVPLGPFLSKSFGTSLSPWVVTLDALEPFRLPGPRQDPEPLAYLRSSGPWAFDIQLEVSIQPAEADRATVVCRSNFKHLYWNLCQQIAHHTIGGCKLRTGDLLASGTISGPTPDSRGSLLELTEGGTRPLEVGPGQVRRFLADNDRVTITGWCQGEGYRVGFGEVSGRLLPAHPGV